MSKSEVLVTMNVTTILDIFPPHPTACHCSHHHFQLLQAFPLSLCHRLVIMGSGVIVCVIIIVAGVVTVLVVEGLLWM